MSMRPILLAALALAACGRSAPPGSPAEAVRLQALAGALSTDADAYGTAASATANPTVCRRARDAYERRVRPVLDAVAGLAAELDRHTDIACTALEPAANRAETERHLAVLDRWTDLLVARAESAGAPAAPRATGPRCVRFEDGERIYLP